MAAVKHILIATDASEGACKAAAFAGDLARALGASISVLYVQSEELILSNAWGAGNYPAASPEGALSIEQVRSTLEQHAREHELPETVKAIGQIDKDVQSAMVWGHPVEEICRYAREQAVDLIVIGSHGRSGIKQALLGSVSHAVANQAPCPVTVVR